MLDNYLMHVGGILSTCWFISCVLFNNCVAILLHSLMHGFLAVIVCLYYHAMTGYVWFICCISFKNSFYGLHFQNGRQCCCFLFVILIIPRLLSLQSSMYSGCCLGLIKLTYRHPICWTIHSDWKFLYRHNAQRHLCQSEGWIFCVSLDMRTCNVLQNMPSGNLSEYQTSFQAFC